ncbi:MAG: dCTP deaminase [Terracidiphilus sp.]
MVLNRSQLFNRMKNDVPWEKRLVVEPFFPSGVDENGASASLDFHLGNRFTLLRSRRAAEHNLLTDEPRQDLVASETFIPMGAELTLHPGHIVLGTTLEWYRFPLDLLAYVIGRSIWGRRGLLIVTAQAVHPGSSGTITLEMSNLGEVGLRLKPGASIGQLIFHEVQQTAGKTGSRHSTFSGASRPILGKYERRPVEQMLLDLK